MPVLVSYRIYGLDVLKGMVGRERRSGLTKCAEALGTKLKPNEAARGGVGEKGA